MSTTTLGGRALLEGSSRASATRWRVAAACVAVGAMVSGANGDYVLSAYSSAPELELVPGQQFSVLVQLEGLAADVHNSCIFSLLLTAPGLEIRGYEWVMPYEMVSPYEYSNPGAAALPAVITPDLFVRPDAPELNDVEFSNVVDPDSGTSTAAPGVILTATFAVPMDYRGPQHVYLFAVPETFANGFDVVPTQIGRGVALNIIVPGPAAAMPGLVLGAGVWCRRRRV
jgi:hypothetical protein